MRIDHPTPAQIPELLHMWKAAFGDYGGFWEMFLDTAFAADHCRCITEDGAVTAALYWFDVQYAGQKMAYIYAVITHPEHRGRGLCRMLMEDTHNLLAAQGYAASLLVPAEEGLREMYRKMGYRDCTSVSEISCSAGAVPASLRALGPTEYAALRREFLPTGGVIQEGENLAFLAAQAQFYVGADFLMAAYTDEVSLHVMELLGNIQSSPGILAALDCSHGVFRVPGDKKPFAMFHPLTENAKAPTYFGFAFD